MKRLLYAAAALLCAVGAGAQMMTVSGSQINDSTGTPLASGTIQFAPVDLNGHPLSYKIGGKGQTLSSPVTATVTAGTFSIALPDVSATNPVNVCFSVTVVDNVTGASVLGPGYTCVQPSSALPSPSWCTSSVCSFDNYIPNNPALPIETVGGAGGTTFNGGVVPNGIQAPTLAAGDGLIEMGPDTGSVGKDALTFNGSLDILHRLGMAALSRGPSDLYFDQPTITNCYSFRFAGFVKSQLCDGLFTPGFPIVLPADPLSDTQAADKHYVDHHVATIASLPATAIYLTDSVTGSEYEVTVASGSFHFQLLSGALSSLLFTDTVTSSEYSVSFASGALTRSTASGGTPVSSFCFTDQSTGATIALSVANGALTKTVGSCSGAVPSISLTDTVTGTIYALAYTAGALTHTP
jgi:hypothetical protein